MMNELSFIRSLGEIHSLETFAADADAVPSGEGTLLVSTDSFSEREDFLTGLEPCDIGRIMAYGACSDLLAAGARPAALVQTWLCDDRHRDEFYLGIAAGIEDVVRHYKAKVIGGDVGTAREWSWNATVFGYAAQPVRRVAARRVEFELYAFGPLGEANLSIATGMPLPRPVLHEPVPSCSLFATDTSGGFFDALENFRRVNPGLHLEVDLDSAVSPDFEERLPSGVMAGWTLVGGVGEYELVFAVPIGTMVESGIKIGCGYFTEGSTEIVVRSGKQIGRMIDSPPDWRAVAPEAYLSTVAAYWERLFTEGK